MAVVVVDSSVVIGLLDPTDARHNAAVASIGKLEATGATITVSATTIAETLVFPLRAGGAQAKIARAFFADPKITVEPVTAPIAERAAELRAAHDWLKLPDAVIVATGEILSASSVITADKRLARLKRVKRI